MTEMQGWVLKVTIGMRLQTMDPCILIIVIDNSIDQKVVNVQKWKILFVTRLNYSQTKRQTVYKLILIVSQATSQTNFLPPIPSWISLLVEVTVEMEVPDPVTPVTMESLLILVKCQRGLVVIVVNILLIFLLPMIHQMKMHCIPQIVSQ